MDAVKSGARNAYQRAQIAVRELAAWERAGAPEYTRDQLRAQLVGICGRVGDYKNAEKLVRRNPEYANEWLAEAQWKSGRFAQFQKTFKCLLENASNIYGLQIMGSRFSRFSDAKSLQKIWKRALKIEQQRDTPKHGLHQIGSLCELSKLAHYLSDKQKCEECLLHAEKLAQRYSKSRPPADLKTTTWLCLTDAYKTIGDFKNAQRATKLIPNQGTQCEKLAAIMATIGADAEAEALVLKRRTAEGKVDLALWIARHLILEND